MLSFQPTNVCRLADAPIATSVDRHRQMPARGTASAVQAVTILAVLLAACTFPASQVAGQVSDPEFFDQLERMLPPANVTTDIEPDRDVPPEPIGKAQDQTIEDPLPMRRRLLLGAARNATAQGDVELAHRRYEAVLEEFPDDDATRYELVGLLMRWGKWRQAEVGIRQLLQADPDHDEYQETLADILIQQQRLTEATTVLVALSEREELSPRAAIRLGRVLAWQRDFERAEAVIARVAGGEGSMPVELRLDLAKYYLESNQPRRALDRAAALERQGVDEVDIDVIVARAHAELGHTDEALQRVERIGRYPSRDLRPRLDLADAFYRSEHDQLALALYRQAIGHGHRDATVMAKVANVQVRLCDLPGAWETLETAKADTPQSEGHWMLLAARANYLVAAGRHAEAEQLYRELINADPANVDLQNGYAHLWFAMGDYRRAASEYRIALAKGPGSTKTLAFLAQSLARNRQFDQALRSLDQAAQDPAEQMELLVPRLETMAAAGRYSELPVAGEQALARTKAHRDRARIMIEMGFAKLELGDPHAAERLFETVLHDYDPNSPQATYGLIRVYQRSGDAGAAEAIFADFSHRIGDDLSRRMQMANLATADCDGRLAEQILLPAYAVSPDNPYLLIRLGEAASLTDRTCGTCRDRNYFLQAISLQPNNTRARLGLARSYARTRHVTQSQREYHTVLTDLPSHRPANEELSRLTYVACGVDSGMAAYDNARRRLEVVRDETPTAAPIPAAGDGLTPEFGMDIDARNEIASHRTGSTELEQRLLSLEASAKWYKLWRPRQSLCFYRSLVEVDPINEEAYFDLGQVYGAMDYTGAAAGRFCQLLDVNPCHTEAQIALRRTHLERSPQLWSDVDFLDESGRDGLTEMTRLRLSTLGRYPLGDENEYLYAGYAHEWLDGAYGSGVQADAALIGGSRRIWDYTTLFADMEVADYTTGFSTRPQLRTGLLYRDCYDVQWMLTGFLDNVASNRESINQDIFRSGLELSAVLPCSWRWYVKGTYRWSNYSDDNNSHEAWLASEYLLRHGCGRRQWRSIIDGYFCNFDEQTRRGPDPIDLAGTVHPYFAPQGFAHATIGLEYKRWLSRYTFKYANQWWWSAYVGGRADSEGVGYGLGALRCRRDHCNWLTTGIDASLVRSPVYDRTGILAYLIVRFD